MGSETDTSAGLPLVSIGIPVYNEARFIEAALNCLLRQDYEHFEIVISDNASTDETGDICRRMAAGDDRVIYRRFSENRGATDNFQCVLDLARGKYFMWASGHDLWSENLVSACVQELERHEGAAIALGTSQWIDAEGRALTMESGYTDTRGMDPVARFFTVFWGNMHPILGLLRLDYVRDNGKIQNCAGSDLIVLAALALKGDFVHARTATWYRREFRGAESHSQRMRRYRSAEYGLGKSLMARIFPLLKLPTELLRILWRSRLPWLSRILTILALGASFPVRYVAGRR